MSEVWKAVIWSMKSLSSSYWPTHNWLGEAYTADTFEGKMAGKPLMSYKGVIYFFAWVAVSCDQDYLSNVFKFPHWNIDSPCPRCDCNLDSKPWTDVIGRPWHLVTLLQWLMVDPDTLHPLFQHPETLGFTVFSVIFDLMHVVNLGVLQSYLASVYWMLVFASDLDGSFDHRVEYVYSRLLLAYDSVGTKSSERLTLTKAQAVMDLAGHGPKEFPELNTKAAVTRNLLTPLRMVVVELAEGKAHWASVLEGLRAIERFYTLIMPRMFKLSAADAAEARCSLAQFLSSSARLTAMNANAVPRPVRLFGLTIKHHVLCHLGDDLVWTNPRMYWVYKDEDFVGKIADLARVCSASLGPYRMHRKLLSRYVMRLYVRFSRRTRARG